MQLNDPWQPWLGNMGQKRAPLGLNQGGMEKKLVNSGHILEVPRVVTVEKLNWILEKALVHNDSGIPKI